MAHDIAKCLYTRRILIGNFVQMSLNPKKRRKKNSRFKINFSYTMAGDICIVKVYFSACDHPRLNPIRVIIDEVTACNG